MANTLPVIQNSTNPTLYGRPGLVEGWLSPGIMQVLATPLDTDTQTMHPTLEETMRIKMIQVDVRRNLDTARNACDMREWMATMFMVPAVISMLGSILAMMDGFTVFKAVYMTVNVMLIVCAIVMVVQYKAVMRKIRWATHFCSSLSPWPDAITQARKRLSAKGVALPSSLQALVPFLKNHADERVLSNNGGKDTLAMIRLAAMLDTLSRDDGEAMTSIVLSGETEELLGRVGDTLGAFPSRVKPGEVML